MEWPGMRMPMRIETTMAMTMEMEMCTYRLKYIQAYGGNQVKINKTQTRLHKSHENRCSWQLRSSNLHQIPHGKKWKYLIVIVHTVKKGKIIFK